MSTTHLLAPLPASCSDPGSPWPDTSGCDLHAVQNFGEHGRELITVEVALRLLAALGNPRGALERSQARGQPAQRLGHLLRQCVFKVGCALCVRHEGRGKVVLAGPTTSGPDCASQDLWPVR